jgi:hypothetical protein
MAGRKLLLLSFGLWKIKCGVVFADSITDVGEEETISTKTGANGEYQYERTSSNLLNWRKSKQKIAAETTISRLPP